MSKHEYIPNELSVQEISDQWAQAVVAPVVTAEAHAIVPELYIEAVVLWHQHRIKMLEEVGSHGGVQQIVQPSQHDFWLTKNHLTDLDKDPIPSNRIVASDGTEFGANKFMRTPFLAVEAPADVGVEPVANSTFTRETRMSLSIGSAIPRRHGKDVRVTGQSIDDDLFAIVEDDNYLPHMIGISAKTRTTVELPEAERDGMSPILDVETVYVINARTGLLDPVNSPPRNTGPVHYEMWLRGQVECLGSDTYDLGRFTRAEVKNSDIIIPNHPVSDLNDLDRKESRLPVIANDCKDLLGKFALVGGEPQSAR